MTNATLHRPGNGRPGGRAARQHTIGWPDEDAQFADRTEAGQILAALVADRLPPASARPVVFGLPKAGVLVAREIAKAIGGDLDVIIANRVGLPWRPEFTVGAVATEGPPLFDRNALACANASMTAMAPAIKGPREAARQRTGRLRGDRPIVDLARRPAIVVDDGLTPSVVTRAAIRAVRAMDPSEIIFAAPVCAAEQADWLRTEADAVLHLHSPRVFHALGLWYRDPTPVTDHDVAQILALTWGSQPPQAGDSG